MLRAQLRMTRSTLITRLPIAFGKCAPALTPSGIAERVRGGALLLCAAGFAFVVGCSQDEGEPCQVNGDCGDGLVCVRARGSERGLCEDENSKDAGAGGTSGAVDAAALPNEDAGADSGIDGGGIGMSGPDGAVLPAQDASADTDAGN
jgi:hypothetical protein